MKTGKRILALFMTMLMVLSCWVWFEPVETSAANLTGDSNYLFAYFTGTSIDGQTIHLAVSKDGLNYTALRNNEPVIVPSKGTGCVRDPYLWYNEQDNYYYILATDLDFTDTGSDYSDNSESFIVWRSKDLVHWYDETMIDVKTVLGKLGINNNTMQAVWAPQVLWDGSSYVVYFSLQCDATSNGYWNPLTIVYLKTTDLLDQSAYYEYGVIHNPGRHVIDADIIKNPTTGQYYMFYKDESASGGIQSIYYMVSDSSPIGPYYAPNNANDGRGPQLFASIGKNLEGCNSFFDDKGNLITYVDEYDYTNSAGQKEAHFHVSSTSDFTNYTTLSNSSHNINSLSPRHGSVVKITDEEYNRLVNNAYGITSSSFPATEELSDHLVGRYFTTSDYTYNAANGKKDLKLTDGTITTGQEASGEWFANFQTAGAEINLADLISGDLNIKDGFTITFSALVPSSLGSNARFFDISNNWSQRTNPNEVYLHMSPVADQNGLYVGAFNGPKTTTSWTWASQGKNYNDGAMHDYIISFADGNMIMYIDGELAMKRDRFNFNAEYGDNFLDDNWFKEIGNSVMRIGKSEWADPLFTGYLQDFCIYDCSMSYYDVKTIQNEQDIEAGITHLPLDGSSFGTAIPSWSNSTTSQMSSLAGTYFSNILYSPQVTGMPSGATKDSNPTTGNGAAAAFSDDGVYFGVYYANNTVIYLDGKTTPKIPVYAAGRNNEMNRDGDMLSVFPINSTSDTSDSKLFSLIGRWKGWNSSSEFHSTVKNPDNITTGHNSSTSGNCDLQNSKGWTGSQGDRKIAYIANALQLNESQVSINSDGFQKVNLSWHFKYNWERYSSGWKGWETRNKDISSAFNIWIVDIRGIIAAKEEIAANYNSIVTNTSYCPSTISAYKAIVETIAKFNPQSYNYAGNAEAAVKNCSTQIQKLVDDYNKAKANLGGCKKVDIPGREATCTAPGMTAGSYCEYCGEFYSEQKVTSEALGHNFVEVDKTKVQCTRCGEIRYNAPLEIRYENLFSFNAWAKSPSNSIGWSSNTTISTNMIDGSITIVNGEASGEEVYNNASGNVTRNNACYAIPVEGGKTYVYEFTATGDYAGEVFIFKYDANGNVIKNASGNSTYGDTNISGTGTVSKEFTVESNTAWVEFRFDANAKGKITYSDIGIYTKESFESFARYTQEARIAYYYGEDKDLCTPTGKLGYKFGGWYASGKEITSTKQLPTSTSTVVYAEWEKQVNVTFDNLIDIYEWGTAASNGTISDIEENGFTLTSNNGAGEATSTSPLFPVTAGKKYLVDIDIIGENWDVYIFFYDNNTSSGLGIDFHDDNTRRFSSSKGGNYDRHGSAIFTAPAGATRAVIRVDANGSNNTVRFEDIRVSDATDVFVPTANKLVASGSTYGTLPVPERDGYEFIGWFNGNNYVTEDTIMTSESTVNLTSKWVVSSVVVDFDSPVEINPFDSNNSPFTINKVNTDGSYGAFKTNNKTITYTPTKVFNGIDVATYTISFSGTTRTFDLLVIPASSVLYNEDKLTVSNTTGNAWVTDGTANNTKQTQSDKNDVYGYDANYKDDTGFSYGTAYKASVDATNTRSQTLKFTYTGNAIDLYASCGENTGIYIITIRNSTGIEKVYITDTYFSDSSFYGNDGKINQVPIVHHENSNGFGNYTVEVTSAYLASVVGQRSTFSMRDNGEVNFYTADITEDAKEAVLMYAEMEDLLGENIEVTFCDENSVFNGGSGVPVKSDFGAFALTAQADNGEEYTSLDNYFDGFRVYNNAADYDGMYLESEQGAAYYNVVENLLSDDDIITSTDNLAGIAYIEEVADDEYNLRTYAQNGPKNELYLNPNATITLTVKATNPDAKAMISLRTVNGNPASVAIANGAVNGSEIVKDTYTITNTTDMYYRINSAEADENAEAFIITIQNTGDSYLVIGTLRLCNGLSLAPMMMSAMPRVRMMMAAPATETIPNAPVEDESEVPPYEPSEPETDVPETDTPETDVPVTDNSDNSDNNSFFDNIIGTIKALLNKLLAFINKVFDQLKAFVA